MNLTIRIEQNFKNVGVLKRSRGEGCWLVGKDLKPRGRGKEILFPEMPPLRVDVSDLKTPRS